MKKFAAAILASATTLGLSACQEAQDSTGPATSPDESVLAKAALAKAALDFPGSDAAAEATISFSDDHASITITANGLTEGERGFHLHETGACDAPDFTSAGGHLNPLGKAHGSKSEGGSHIGDLPNLETGPDGSATLTYTIEGTREQILEWLFDEDGTAVVIHEGADDYMTDPSGAAGARIACGVVQRAG